MNAQWKNKTRRLPARMVTPGIEDAGLYKRPLTNLKLALMPEYGRNRRQDLMVKAYLETGQEMTVLFAGRRAKQTGAILRQFARSAVQYRNAVSADELSKTELCKRFGTMTSIDGAWRIRFIRDQTGWEDKDYQFIAARWRLMGPEMSDQFFGALPFNSKI